MAKDKDGRPILAADDWKTGKDRKEEASAVGRGKIIRIFLALGLLVIAGWIFTTANMTDEVGDSLDLIEELPNSFGRDAISVDEGLVDIIESDDFFGFPSN